MKTIILECRHLNERKKAHRYLKKMLDFPEYYGKNLDALFDCLTELGECVIQLEGAAEMKESLGYGARVIQVIEDAANENPNIRLTFGDTSEAEQSE